MKKILLNGVDGNFGSRSARVLLEKYPHEALIFTAPTKNGLEKYQEMGIETRIADFNNAEKLTEAFKDADTVILISMPFVGPKRRAAHKIAIDAAVAAGVNKLVYTSIVGAGHEDINAYEVNDHVWTERYIKKQPIHYLILRDSQYAEAMVSTFVEAVENTNGIIRNNMGDGKMAFVSRDDCALAAACAAMSDWEDRIVDINGAELLKRRNINISTMMRCMSSLTPSAFQGQRRKCGRTRRRTFHFAQMEWCPLAGQSV